MRTLCVLLLLITAGAPAWAQMPNRTPEKIEQDRKEVERLKKLYPEEFRFNQAPWVLEDSSTVVRGYSMGSLWLQNNYIVDSIHNNFHNEMPDTTTVTPYSSISLGGARATISFLSGVISMGMGKARIVPTDSAMLEKDYNSLIGGASKGKGLAAFFPPSHEIYDTMYFRISLNGRLLFDWKNMVAFPVTYCEETETYTLRGTKYLPATIRSFGKSYLICDTTLSINDQLLIEVKDHNKNWMLGRYNFTRVAASPQPTALRITGEDGRSAFVPPLEKKTLTSNQAPRIAH